MKWALFFSILFLTVQSRATIAVDFFLSPSASVRSGQETLEKLESTVTGSEAHPTRTIEFNKSIYNLNPQDVLTINDLCPASDIIEKIEDCLALTVITTKLKSSPLASSSTLVQIPSHQKIEIISVFNSWFQVRFGGRSGYVESSHLLTAADFAISVKIADTEKPVSYRLDAKLYDSIGKKNYPAEIFKVDLKKGIIVKSNLKNGIEFLNRVKIINHEINTRYSSLLPEHGKVFWSPQIAESESRATIQKLIKKEVFSFRVNPKNKLEAYISAQGIYKTDDGVHWQKISEFENSNYPIGVDPEGRWYIGPFRQNQNKQFEPYIRWDKITSHFPNNISQISVLDHAFPKKGSIRIKISAVVFTELLESNDDGFTCKRI